jgi:hypothetical protein
MTSDIEETNELQTESKPFTGRRLLGWTVFYSSWLGLAVASKTLYDFPFSLMVTEKYQKFIKIQTYFFT